MADLASISSTTPARISSPSLRSTPRSRLMPTPMKKRPSRMPRKGSMSVSSWWRKVDSESSTPARKAPMAMERPPSSMASAAPRTTSRAAAVITSRAPARASRANIGLSSQRPAATRAASESRARPMETQREPSASCPGARIATRARSGTIARSSSSRMETMRCPAGVETSPFSSSTCMAMAVEDRTKPMAATKATAGAKPASQRMAVSTAPQAQTWATPRPKISRRRLQRREGCISSPMMKRNMTTPSSAMCSTAPGSATRRRPKGPMARPAAR